MQKSVFLPKDSSGKTVHAHGGQILKWEGKYYWIGEDRTARNKVSCYVSDDLQNWLFSEHLLTVDSPVQKHPHLVTDLRLEAEGRQASIGEGCNIERPKVLYNRLTNKFVMWMHWELPDDYREARCAVAVSDTINGEYTYLGSFNPEGYMSRDCTVFQEEDGTAYFISTSRENLDLHIYRLTEDYLGIDCMERVLFPGQQQEAPTLFKKDGLYYLLTSGCTGWAPNQSSWACAKSLSGLWSLRRPFGNATTFHSQPTWVLPLKNAKTSETNWWYLGDRWGSEKDAYFTSSYVLLPVTFQNGVPSLAWDENIYFPD